MPILRPRAETAYVVIGPKMPKQTAADERNARRAVKDRDSGLCVRCGAVATDWDHRKNRSQGGRWCASNGQALCRGCHIWRTQNPSAAVLEGFACPGWADPAFWPAWREDVRSWVLYLNEPDTHGRWWSEITETTADMLMGRMGAVDE